MDELLLQRARSGDPAAFEQLVTPHEAMLWRVCWHYTGNREDAADCLQETMLKAWRSLSTYRGEAALEGWLYRLCASCCLDYLRRQKHMPRPAATEEAADHLAAQPSDEPTPEETLTRREERNAIKEAMTALPDEMREVLILCAIEGKSIEEAATLTGAPPGTVKSRMNRAREKLKKILQTTGNYFPPDASLQKKGGRPNG